MQFLQLHDGPYSFPSYTGKLQPLKNSLNPFAPGAPVWKTPPFKMISGCSQADIQAQFIPGNASGWNVQLDQINQAQQIWKNYQSMVDAKGTGSVPIYDASGTITGYKAGTKAEEAVAWYKLGVKIGQLLRAQMNSGQVQRLNETAQAIWNQNKWDIQNICSQSLSALRQNTQLLYDSMQWWLNEQSNLQAQWAALPAYKRNNLASPQLAGAIRIANRNVVVRQNAMNIFLRQIQAKGGSFTPNGGSSAASGKNLATILTLVVAGASFLK